ncbi:hypothetical protein Pcinc_016662 [Petrolisthes cinctipes]|uniref:Uncharacterized protein n=1 Tax=Petrolisthes cinctipes TaxID=88211 RepID=A0AAE1FQV4_PETCI|nr:hypothetical protein Pcinc_016659 [Petrolisthes cinctipes]KAK3878715.1 hypothetical protein Pcinc_016662 [Petrolisthes cinctipes]
METPQMMKSTVNVFFLAKVVVDSQSRRKAGISSRPPRKVYRISAVIMSSDPVSCHFSVASASAAPVEGGCTAFTSVPTHSTLRQVQTHYE